MEKRCSPRSGILVVLALAVLVLISCQARTGGRLLERQDLFPLEYGGYGKAINFSTQGDVLVDFDSREGIFHILDIPSRKVLRLSSYGDILSMLFDPGASLPPEFIPSSDSAEIAESEAPGRYVAPTVMISPSLIAIDSAQTLYLVDKPPAPLAGGNVLRRFGTQGREQKFIGQEGLESTPFPPVQGIYVMEDDSLGIVSSLSDAYLLHRFASSGTLLSAVKLDSGGIALEAGGSYRQNLDGILMNGEGDNFEITLKIDLYGETMDRKSGASAGFDVVESWLAVIDGSSGRLVNKLRIWSTTSNGENPILLGRRDGEYVLMQPGSDIYSYSILVVDAHGKSKGRFRMELPLGTKLVSRLKLVQGNRISGIVGGRDSALVLWWSLP